MTGNQIKGKGFRGALRYNLAKVEKNVAEVLDSTFAGSSEQAIMKEVRMTRSLRPRLQKYFYHTSINFPPGENPSNHVMKTIGLDYLQANGFNQHQFVMFRHHDADHPHLHILVNRIGYDGSVLSDSNDFQRSEKILRQLEIKYNLTKVAPSRQTSRRAPTKDELEMMKRTGSPSSKLKLQNLIGTALKGKPTLDEFTASLRKEGVSVILNKASTGHVSGISYRLGGFRSTGTKLGSAFKWRAIEARLNNDHLKPNTDGDRWHHQSTFSDPDRGTFTNAQDLTLSEILTELVTPELQPDVPNRSSHQKKKRKRKLRRS